jgi:HlyD family secretion protein
MKKKSNRRWFLILAGILVLAVAGYFAYPLVVPGAGATGQSTFQTQPVRKGNLTAFVGATGTVRSNQTAVLAWATSGIVEKILVQKGQQIPADTSLAELEQTSLPQAIIMAQSDLVTAQRALDDLLTSNEARANAEIAMLQAQKALDDAEKARKSKQFQRASQNTIDIAQANLTLAEQSLGDAEEIYNRNQNRSRDDPIYAAALSQLASARQIRDRAKYNLLYAQGLPSPLDVQQADANVDLAKAQLLTAKRAWERVKDGPNPDDVAAAEAHVAALQATLNMARLTAPFTGTITAINTKSGDQVAMGTVAFQLDDLSHLYLDVAVNEDEISQVQVGQPAAVSLDALPGKEFSGVVTEVAAVGKPTAGTVNFIVTVEIQSPGAEIKPGMTSSVVITTGESASTLLVPARAIYALDGQPVVYLLKDGRLAPVAVAAGPTSGADRIITSGSIKSDDLVVLNPDGK